MTMPSSSMLQPLEDRLIIQPDPEKAMTDKGVVVPEQHRLRPNQGTVIAAGPGRISDNGTLIPMRCKTSDRVMYGQYSGAEIQHHADTLIIMRESDVFAILPPENGVSSSGPDPASSESAG